MKNILSYSGLYRIVSPNGKMYIGITVQSFRARFRHHKTLSRKLVPKTLIARAIRKHGIENMLFETLVVCRDKEELMRLERSVIARFNTMGPFGYNQTPGGEVFPDLTKESRAKISAKSKGKAHSWSHDGGVSKRPVVICGVEYPSIAAAARFHGKSAAMIRHRLASSNFPEWVASHIIKLNKNAIGRPIGVVKAKPRKSF